MPYRKGMPRRTSRGSRASRHASQNRPSPQSNAHALFEIVFTTHQFISIQYFYARWPPFAAPNVVLAIILSKSSVICLVTPNPSKMSDTKTIAPSPTEGDLDSSSSSTSTSQFPSSAAMPKGRAPEAPTSATQQSDNIAHALAGAGGGLIAMTLTYPLITLSTRAQVEASRSSTSLLETIKHIIRREGFTGLYAGLDSALFGISVTNFIYYYWYEWTRAFFEKAAEKAGRASKKLTTVESMIAGAIAGSATVMLTNPIWVVNTRMTTRKEQEEEILPGGEKRPQRKAPSTIGTLMSLIRDEGATSLFAGVMPALVLVINPILQYTLFEQLKNTLEKRRRVTPTDAFYLGAIGKLAATTITYPYITVKSRAHVATKNQPVEGMWKSLNKIVKEEGVSGLYKGRFHCLDSRD
jgi:solute carrier family 25 (peroxisomal adenine nucleotide transporter), member 17